MPSEWNVYSPVRNSHRLEGRPSARAEGPRSRYARFGLEMVVESRRTAELLGKLGAGDGPLYVGAAPPAQERRKSRTPKVVAKGLEAAFRKRQNIGLAHAKAEVLALFDRAISEVLADPPAVRSLFSSVTERLSGMALNLLDVIVVMWNNNTPT